MKKLLFKQGYQINITTWENDGDNYQTETLSGLDEEDVKFLVYFIKNFASTQGSEIKAPRLGNHYELRRSDRVAFDTEVIRLIKEFVEQNPEFSSSELYQGLIDEDTKEIEPDCYSDFLFDLGLRSDWAVRVYERHEVLLHETDVYVEDVTAKFK